MANKDYNLKITYNGDSDSLERDKKLLEDMVALRNELARKVQIVPDGEEDRLRQMVLAQQRLTEEINKQRDSNNKRQVEEQKELGIIGQLIVEQKKLKQSIKDATSIEDLKKFQVQLEKNKKTQKELNSLAKENTNTFGNALSSFQFKFNALGQAIGQLAVTGFTALIHSAKDFAKESVQAFLEAELNAKKLEVALTNISGEEQGAFTKLIEQSEQLQKASIFSDDDIQRAQTALVQYGLTSDEVEKLVPKIIDLASAQGIDLASATETSIKAINGQTKGLKTAGIAFTDTGTKAGNLAKLTENLNKFQGQSSAILETNQGKLAVLSNAYDDALESLGSFILDAAEPAVSILKFLANGFEIAGDEAEAFVNNVRLSDKELVKLNDTMLDFAINAQKQAIAGFEQLGDSDGALAEAVKRLKELNALKFDISVDNFTDKEIAKEIERLEQTKLAFLAKGELSNAEKIEILRAKIDVKSKLNESTRDEKSAKDKTERARNLERELRDIRLQQEDSYRREREKIVNEANDRIEDLQKDKTVKNEEERSQLIIEIRKKLQKDLEKLNIDGVKIEEDKAKKTAEIQAISLESQKEKDDRHLKYRQEQIQKEVDFYAKSLDLVSQKISDALEEQSQKRIASIDKSILSNEKDLEAQKLRAEQGLSNTLEFEQKKAADLEAQRQKEFEKQKRREKILSYYNLLSGYAKTDANTALKNTARDIAISEAVTLAFAEKGGVVGEMAETTTLTGGSLSRSHKSGKDQLVVAEEGEGMLSLDRMNKLGGSAGFNKLAHLIDGGYLTDGVMFERQPIITAVPMFHQNSNKELVREMRELKKAIEDKPVSNTSLDKDMNVIIETIEGNNRKLVKKMSKQPGFRR